MRLIFTFIVSCFVLAACGPLHGSSEPKLVSPPESAQIKLPISPSNAKPILASELSGEKFYKKCAACHQLNGEGIPGAFPELNTSIGEFSASAAGRSYLVLVIYNGLRGPLETKNGTFNGVMMRQAGGKSASDVADLLNYMLNNFYPDHNLKPFTVEEVQRVKDRYGRLRGDKVSTYRPKAE